MKLWQKDINKTSGIAGKEVEKFTVGKDKEFDLLLAPFDVLGSIAHVTMLETVGLLTKDEKDFFVYSISVFSGGGYCTNQQPTTIQICIYCS